MVNSYITNQENGDIVISKTEDGYLVSKFPIDTEHEEGGGNGNRHSFGGH